MKEFFRKLFTINYKELTVEDYKNMLLEDKKKNKL